MLAAGIKSKNFTEIDLAQNLLEVAKKTIDKTTAAGESCSQHRHEIYNKRRQLLEGSMETLKKITVKSDNNEKQAEYDLLN